MSYRKKYEQYLGAKLDLDVHVHHLDHNQQNNCISNLVAIPDKLHSQYHSLERRYSIAVNGMKTNLSDYDFYEFNYHRVLPKLKKAESEIIKLKLEQDKQAQKLLVKI